MSWCDLVSPSSLSPCLPPPSLPPQFDLDSTWTFILGAPASSSMLSSIHSVCSEAAFLLLAMLRSMLNLVRRGEGD